MAKYLNSFPKNLTEYPNSFERQGAFPLDKYSVFTSLTAAEDYAKDAESVAYVGQPLAVVTTATKEIELEDGEKQTVIEYITKYYLIGDVNGTLIELGTAGSEADLDSRLQAVEVFFDSVDDKDGLVETLLELQNYIAEHGQDFTGLIADVKNIYTPEIPGDPNAGTPTIPENGVVVEKEKQLRKEIEEIYDADGGVAEDGKTAIATGLLVDEKNERIAEDLALGERIDDIYDADGGLADDGVTKIPSGRLVKEAEAREEADAAIYNTILGSDPREEETEFHGVTGILAGIRGTKDANGKYQYDTIKQYIQNEIPIATTDRLGRVLSSTEKDQITVESDGTMTVNSLNANKLYQTEYLILDGGNATKLTFTQEEQEPTLEEN